MRRSEIAMIQRLALLCQRWIRESEFCSVGLGRQGWSLWQCNM